MQNRSFKFSLYVGISLVAFGAFIASLAPIGFSLVGLGFAIAILAFLTRGREHGANAEELLSSLPINEAVNEPTNA